jgi:hypothetical protein
MLDPVEPEFGQKAGFFSLIRSLAAIAKIAQTAVASGVPLASFPLPIQVGGFLSIP